MNGTVEIRCHFCGGSTRPHCPGNTICTWRVCDKKDSCGFGDPVRNRWQRYLTGPKPT